MTRHTGDSRIAKKPGKLNAAQLRVWRVLPRIDQRRLAEMAISLPTFGGWRRATEVICGKVDSLMMLIEALDALGIERAGEAAASPGGGRVARLKA